MAVAPHVYSVAERKLMGNRSYALLTGLFVLVLGTAIGVAAWWMSGGQTQRSPYLVVSKTEVSGLNDASAVFYRGVRAGRVLAIRFNPDDVREILIDIEIDSELPITEGTWATLRPQGVTGLSQLALHDDGSQPIRLTTSSDDPARIPMRPGILERLMSDGADLFDRVQRIGGQIEELFSDGNVDRIGVILEHLEGTAEWLVGFDRRFDPVFNRLPALADEAKLVLEETRSLVTGLQDLPPELEALTRDARELSKTGQRIGEELHAELTPALKGALDELSQTSLEIQRLARQLQNQPQSLLQGPQAPMPGPGEDGYRKE